MFFTFRVGCLFTVSCKNVGIMIYKLKSFSCKSFAAFFHLWSGGSPNWRREYDLWCYEQDVEWTTVGSKIKKSFAKVVRSPPAPKRSIFLCLKYPNNYYANFDTFASGPKRNLDVLSPDRKVSRVFHPSDRSPPRPKCVLCWVHKAKASKPAPSQETFTGILNKTPSQERSISFDSKSKASTRLLASSNSRPHSSLALSPAPDLLFHNCLGLGHFKKDCRQSIQCKACFNYGHVALRCLSKKRNQWCFWVVSCLEGEGAGVHHLYPGDPQSLGPSVLPISIATPSTVTPPS